MTEERKAPAIRFKEFSGDAWKKRKLEEVADFAKGKGYSKGDLEMSGTPIVLYGRLYTNYETIIDDVDTYVTMKEQSVLSEGNEIIVPSSGESSEEISRASVVAKKGVILGGDLNIIRLNGKFSSVFVAISLSNGSQQKELSKRAQGKSVVHLHNSDLKEVNLFYPTPPEQRAIGSFFQELDQLITLQQRKLEKSRRIKKAMLQKMFPENKQTVPAIRFKEFSDDVWKKRKLGDLGSVEMCKRIFKEETSEDFEIPFFKIGTFGGKADTYITRKKFEEYKAKYPYPNKGDLLISASGSIGRVVEYNGQEEYYQDSNIVWLNHSGKIENSFLKQFYSIVTWSGIEGTTIKRLYNKNILETKISLPTPPEQRAIGSFFQDLDRFIALQQCRLDKLQNMKKALLEQMMM